MCLNLTHVYQIEPSEHLQYTPCFDTFECARLQVPLDWNNTDPSFVDNVAIAIMRLPAKVPVTDPRYGGPILINPGGPGGSGVDWLRGDGVAIQTLFDAAYENDSSTYVVNSSTAKYFDIVGFDPRGVSNSTPFLSCLEGEGSPTSWGGNQALGTLEGPLELLWQENVASNEQCLNGPGITPNGSVIADFTSTVYVARDVVSGNTVPRVRH
jgi:pimeloyl-ACP methyl ester carboxylesterase